MSKEVSIHILRKTVIDGILIGVLIVWLACVNTLWTPFQRGFFCGDESIMFPYKDDTTTVFVLRLVSLAPPALIIIICEYAYLHEEKSDQYMLGIRIPAWLQGVYCVGITYAMGCFFNELLIETAKNTIGRPRPHFLDVCKPTVNCSLPEWQNRYIQVEDYKCEGERTHLFANSRKSFPSGHSAIAAYAAIFIALYLQKRMTWQGTRLLRHMIQFVALMLSWYCSLSRVSDFKHHWSDVLAGNALGTILAVLTWQFCTDLIEKNHSQLPHNEVNLGTNE